MGTLQLSERDSFTDRLFVGTSGLVLPYRNMSFYPEEFSGKSRLEVYGLLNNSIEINSSFYRIPLRSTVAKWNGSVPDGFRFTYKLIRTLTHTKGMEFPPADLERFMDSLSAVGETKRGCILVQFPASFRTVQLRHFTALLAALNRLNKGQQWRISVEFRHDSWYREETFSFLKKNNVGIVIHDMQTGMFNDFDNTGTEHVYLRFHGPEGNYRGSYDDAFLSEYAGYIRAWLGMGKTVFAYFNNTMGDALQNSRTLLEELSGY